MDHRLSETEPAFTFPVLKGVQARHEYYVAMWNLRILSRISIFDEDELPPELRAQRTLNRARIPEISSYILANPEDYIFSALTLSIDSHVEFEPLPGQDKLGILRVPMDARFIINDGQHRRAAIIEALSQRAELGHETIAVVFFLDIGLQRCQQMFADLNRHAIRPSRSLGLLYDHRSEKAKLAKLVICKSEFFRELVEMEKSSLAKRSRKLFTLSSFCNACSDLLQGIATGDLEEDAGLAREFWETVAEQFVAWQQVKMDLLPASEVRESSIHSHSIALQALGIAGNALLKSEPVRWKPCLKNLENLNWSRSNVTLWEGRALLGGRVQKTSASVVLTTTVIKRALNLALTEEESRIEANHSRGLANA